MANGACWCSTTSSIWMVSARCAAAGDAQVVITSSLQTASDLGQAVLVDVFSEGEALAFLAERPGSTDTIGARELAAELGCLPLALAQAAAVIARQRLGYAHVPGPAAAAAGQ